MVSLDVMFVFVCKWRSVTKCWWWYNSCWLCVSVFFFISFRIENISWVNDNVQISEIATLMQRWLTFSFHLHSARIFDIRMNIERLLCNCPSVHARKMYSHIEDSLTHTFISSHTNTHINTHNVNKLQCDRELAGVFNWSAFSLE